MSKSTVHDAACTISVVYCVTEKKLEPVTGLLSCTITTIIISTRKPYV